MTPITYKTFKPKTNLVRLFSPHYAAYAAATACSTGTVNMRKLYHFPDQTWLGHSVRDQWRPVLQQGV